MYDSRTFKPRRQGTHRYASKAWRDDLDWPGETSRPGVSASVAIAESLYEHEFREDHDPSMDCEAVTLEVVTVAYREYEEEMDARAKEEARYFDQQVEDALTDLRLIDGQLAMAAAREDWYWARVYGQRYDRLCTEVVSEFGFDPRTNPRAHFRTA